MKPLIEWLYTKQLLVYNALFEGSIFYKYMLKHAPIAYDVLGLFRHIANEGYTGQRWGLKDAQVNILGWEGKGDIELDAWLKENKLTRKDMWQAPVDILGKYCVMDVISTYHLYEVFEKVMQKFPEIRSHHRREFLNEAQLVVEQQLFGIPINEDKLHLLHHKYLNDMKDVEIKFLNHPEVVSHIQFFNEESKRKWREDHPKSRKEGKLFNIRSKPQLSWLFYGQLGYTPIKRTSKGKPSIDKKSLKHLGKAAKILIKYNKLKKIEGYVRACIELTHNNLLYAKHILPSAITGRIAGTDGLSIVQLPKKSSLFEAFEAPTGYSIVGLDFDALENKVLAEFSQDDNCKFLYTSGVKNDGYLFVGAHIPQFKKEIRKYYDPFNPTDESVNLCKSKCKETRDILKPIVLGMSFGLGAKGLKDDLNTQGIECSIKDAISIVTSYRNIFPGVEKFKQYLTSMWYKNEGYIINGRGLPMSIPNNKKQDVVNRFCQSTGHCILQLWLYYIRYLSNIYNHYLIPVIPDIHDFGCFMVRDEDISVAVKILQEAINLLNKELGWSTPMTGDVQVGKNVAEVK